MMKKVFAFLMAVVFACGMTACMNRNAEEEVIDTVDTVLVEDTCAVADSAVECTVVEDTVVE
jgi:hypothetical protein